MRSSSILTIFDFSKADSCGKCKNYCEKGSSKRKDCKKRECSIDELKFWFPEDFIDAMEAA